MKVKEKIEEQLEKRKNQFMEVFKKYDNAFGEEKKRAKQELEMAETRVRELEIVLKMFEE
ncbi:hypothetical protein MVQ23_09755 [Fusobacterium necrophorum]|uniref:hypothetical protein n=1 Tax=Fusobacterium necrophorum TaxID=859 RepID=UPI00254B8DD4|nr:hypothetical protein [Fusobacterium necrophorum]MDK4486126.1 hypothetical protein [Fusobacterium necrophorum]